MRRLILTALALILCATADPAAACGPRRRATVYRGASQCPGATPRVVYLPRTYSTLPAPQPAAQAMTAAATPAPVYASPSSPPVGGYAGALAVINAARASARLGPLGWDSGLAYEASRNYGTHGHVPGCGQCQYWGPLDPVRAAREWVASPAHRAILVNATSVIGIGADQAGGLTANAR